MVDNGEFRTFADFKFVDPRTTAVLASAVLLRYCAIVV